MAGTRRRQRVPRDPRPPKHRTCIVCGVEFWSIEDLCCGKKCEKVIRENLKAAGYLTPLRFQRVYRYDDQKEARDRDRGGPWQENAVRALEGD